MGRLMTIAVLVAAVAGIVTISAGGVDIRKDRKSAAIKPRQHPNAPRPHATVGAVEVMKALAFTHPHITITAGRAVRFENHDDVEHTVYASIGGDDGTASFHSARIRPGGTFETPVLVNPGVYSYVCTLHPTVMTGVIEVTG